ncbi:MAG: hypothetical protein DRP29_00285 [Thermodesulfobacteriota bacterium]|nr:MAG: hypothetical protein DRP29_00285 [Thermodesulfobacteriota bacterium]
MGGGGKGKNVIKPVTAVFHAVRHALGWEVGERHGYFSLWGHIKKVWIKLQVMWLRWKIVYGEKLRPILEKLEKLRKFYEEKIKPWLQKLDKWLSNFIKAYLAWKILIERKINYIFEVIENFLVPKVRWLDNVLRHTQQIVSVVSKKLASQIEKVRNTIYKYTIDKIYETERKIVRYVHQIFVPVDKFVYGLKALKEKHIDPLAQGLKGLEEDIDKIIDKDGAPRPIFSMNVLSTGWKEFWEEYLRFHPTPYVVTPPPPVEVDEIYIELEAISPDDPNKLPPEEKEIYEALEEEVAGF